MRSRSCKRRGAGVRNTEILWMLLAAALGAAWLMRDKPAAAARAEQVPAPGYELYEYDDEENDPGAEGP